MIQGVVIPLVVSLAAGPAVLLLGRIRASLAAPAAVGFALASFVAVLVSWVTGGGAVDVAWIPSWRVRLDLTMDGLAAVYGLLATGIGTVVLIYASKYMPLHLAHEEGERGGGGRDLVSFYFLVLLFMGAMVGLAMARDLVLIFVFWDVTAIVSYFLIGFDSHRGESRASALMALIVTGVTAVFLLIGGLTLYARYGTFSVPDLARAVEPGPLLTVSGALILVAGLAKSAQVPFHFWLPRAMAAPTPVSAYLHSAAMVAAGVLLIGRVYPLVSVSDVLMDGLLTVGFLSIAVGGVLALTRDVFKQVLAYSTIAQYGFVIVMYGLGGPYGAAGAAFYVLVHGLCKSALFLTAGTVTEVTGTDRLGGADGTGGMARRLPLLALGSGAAAATLSSLPLTVGFFADEFFFAAALERGTSFAIAASLCAGTTLAYIWRLWAGIFLGEGKVQKEIPDEIGRMVWPVALLGAACLVTGFASGPFERLAEAAGGVSFGGGTPLEAVYRAELLPEYAMAFGAYGFGVTLILTRRLWVGGARSVSRAGRVAGPERAYRATVHGLNALSDLVHRVEINNLRGRVASVLLPTAVLVGLSVVATPAGTYSVGELRAGEAPLFLALVVVGAASVVATVTRLHITLILMLSSASFALAVAYAFYGAPDVALVAVLVEILIAILYFSTMRLIPYSALRKQSQRPLDHRLRKTVVATLAGAFAFVVAWGALSEPPAGQTVATEYVRLTPEAHAKDVVTAVLADFRGLDTLGEITVVCIVLLGIVTLIGHREPESDEEITSGARSERSGSTVERVTRWVSGLLFLPTFVLAAALFVKGYAEAGDGFSAGVVASLGIVLRHLALGSRGRGSLPSTMVATGIAFTGLLVTLGVAAAGLFLGDAPLTQYPPPGSSVVYLGTLELITAVLYDAGIFLLVLGVAVGIVSAFTYATPSEVSGRSMGHDDRHPDPEESGETYYPGPRHPKEEL